MLIIPLGMEGGAVFRVPLISILIVLTCVGAFLATMPMIDESREIDDQLTPALLYWLERPYLELDPIIRDNFVSKALQEHARQYVSEMTEQTNRIDKTGEAIEFYGDLVKRDYELPNAAERKKEQRELDRLTTGVIEMIENQRLNDFAFVPARGTPQRGMITYAFLHVGWLHLALNLFLFALVGPLLEDVWGRAVFLVFFIVGAVGGAVGHFHAEPQSIVPLIGASGAIAACLGAFTVRFARENVQFLIFPAIFWMRLWHILRMPAWLWGILFFGGELLSFSLVGHASGVSYMAHVAGFGLGGALALLIYGTGLEKTLIAPSIEKKHDAWNQHPDLELAHAALVQGNRDEAQRHLNLVIRDQPRNFDARWELAKLAVGALDTPLVTQHADRMLADCVVKKDVGSIMMVLKEFWGHIDLEGLRPAVAFRIATMIHENERAKAEQLFRRVGNSEGTLAGKALLVLATMHLELKDYNRAALILKELLSRDDASAETRIVAQRQMAEIADVTATQLPPRGSINPTFEVQPALDPQRELNASPARRTSAPRTEVPRSPEPAQEHGLSHAPGVIEYDLED